MLNGDGFLEFSESKQNELTRLRFSFATIEEGKVVFFLNMLTHGINNLWLNQCEEYEI